MREKSHLTYSSLTSSAEKPIRIGQVVRRLRRAAALRQRNRPEAWQIKRARGKALLHPSRRRSSIRLMISRNERERNLKLKRGTHT